MNKTKQLNYINIFRAIAILTIVISHGFSYINQDIAVNIYARIHSEIISNGTTLFVFIAGFLFQHLSYKYEFKTYINKKFVNVLSPYIITSIPGVLLCIIIPTIYTNPFMGLEPKFLQAIALYTTGYIHNVPTWYIPMTMLFFFLAPLLMYFERKNILYKILPWTLIFMFLCTQRLAMYVELDSMHTYLTKYLWLIAFFLVNFIHYLPIYILGMYFSANKEKIDTLYKYRNLLFIFMIITSIIDILMIKVHFCNGDISKIFFTLWLLGILKHYDQQIESHTVFNKIANILAQYSFGIFFMHYYMLKIFNLICKTYFMNIHHLLIVNSYKQMIPAFSFGCFRTIFILCLSLLVCYITKIVLNKLGFKNTRWFIGV